MGYITENFQQSYKERSPHYRERLSKWREEPSIVRVDKPLNPERARRLGYKAKKGFFVVRCRVKKGLRKRRNPRAGRKPRHNYRYVQTSLSKQAIAEQRVARKYRNAEVINSYYVGEDGQYIYYEVIMATHDVKDKQASKIVKRRGRAFRGLTSAGRKSRGLL
jgi:large subunit ribosomal protein L15e